MGFLDGFLDPTKNQSKGYKKARKQFASDTAGAKGFYDQQMGAGGDALSMYSNALGLNGTGAQQSFQDAFMTGPAYDANMAAGTAAIDQSAVAGGMGQSGATLKALQKFGQDQYANEYNNYLDQLYRLTGQGNSGAAGVSNLSAQEQEYRLGGARAADQGNAVAAGNISDLLSYGAGFFL